MIMLKIPIQAHGFTTSTYTPMECLNIDFIGPSPDQGYILVIVDTFTPISERSSSSKPSSRYMSDLLAIQDNLLKASAEELLRTDLLHMTTKV